MQLILKCGGWNRGFSLLFSVLMSIPTVIVSCSVVGESYPDGGGSCSFEEDDCGWNSNDNYIWYLGRQSVSRDNYMIFQGYSPSVTARFESPELCPTGNRLYSLYFQYTISYPNTIMISVYIRVNDTSILLWDLSNKTTGYNSKASEHIFINCSECSTKSFRIYFEGTMSSYWGEVNIYSVSFHYNGSLQTLSTCPTHSSTLSTALATPAASNTTEMGLCGCGPAHFNNDNRLPPGAEAGIVIAIILLVAIFISVFVTFHRKGNSCRCGLSCILKNPPNATHTASTDNQQRLGIDNSRYVRHEERLETVPTMPDQYYRKKDLCTKRSVDYELANSSTPFEYSNVLDDKQVKDEVAKMSQSVLPLTYRTIPKDSATYNNYCNTFHSNQEVVSASSNTYNNLQSDYPRKTVSEANVYSLAENTVIYNNINHEENTIETSLNYADEYNKFQRNHEEDGHLASRKAEDTYNHLTNGSDERQQQFSE